LELPRSFDPHGYKEEKLRQVREIRDEIRQEIEEWCEEVCPEVVNDLNLS
jgi:hypothetical protein